MKLTNKEESTIQKVREIADNLDMAGDDLTEMREQWHNMDELDSAVQSLDADKFGDVQSAWDDCKDFVGQIPFADDCDRSGLIDALDELDNDEDDDDE